MSYKTSFKENFHGSVTVGERGQVVIPAELRKKLDIDTGEKLLVFCHPSEVGLVLLKVDSLQQMKEFFTKTLDWLNDKFQESDDEKES